MQTFSFTHFHLHSEYSLRDGLVEIGALVKAVKAQGMQAVALTDRMNLFAAVKFYRAATSAGIKPILGCEIILRENSDAPEVACVFLCQNETGYRHLTQMLSRAYTENQDDRGPWVKYEWLKEYSEGLIVLSGGIAGDLGQIIINDQSDTLLFERLTFWTQCFPNRFYLEITRTHKPQEAMYIQRVSALASAFNIPIIATNDIRFIKEDDFDAHEARVCIHEGRTLDDQHRKKIYTDQQYLKSPEAMQALFLDYPDAIENARELAMRCNVHLILDKVHLPQFPVPNTMTEDDYLTDMTQKGLAERLQHTQSIVENKIYDDRLTLELDVIHRMGFSGYFLIVADFIQWAKNNQIPVGPGRGSGAGSLVAYALKITDLDPIVHELLFERFLNPERVSMPDFDIDFCVNGRDRVIDYVAQKYGRDQVAQIITYGTMAAKAVVRDVGRVLGHPYGFVDSIAKMIPFEIGITLEKALEQEEALKKRYDDEEDVKGLLDLAKKLEGTTRNVGKHAGGVVISASALTDYTPLYCEPDGTNRVTQFDKGDVEAVGLVKFDFLGLKTLTIIDGAVKIINSSEREEGQIDITQIPIDDPKTFELLKTSKTTALFQLESRGMRELVHRLQLDCFDDVMALVALYRPGPLQSGMVDDFIDRKQGKTEVVYPHPDLEAILKPTYGVILYQEQVMQIARVLAGYTLGGADILRSAMGKKKVEEMAKQRKIFIDGSVARGVDGEQAAHIFDLMEKFAGYGFNKSHSAAYALVSYQTAWLKAHYPAEFMASVLTEDMDNTDKISDFMEECRSMHLTVKSPNINTSDYTFTVLSNEIVYGLGAIKGVGQGAIELLIQERKKGPFKSLFNLCERVDLRRVSRKVLEALIGSGACDVWQINRGILFANIDKAVKAAEKVHHQKTQGQRSLFDMLETPENNEQDAYDHNLSFIWSVNKQLHMEKEKLGFYLSGHPFAAYRQELGPILTDSLCNLDPQKSTNVTVGGLAEEVRKIITKRGKRMAILTLNDESGRLEMAIFSELLEELLEKIPPVLAKGEILIVQGPIEIDQYSEGVRMRAETIMRIPEARERYGDYLLVTMQSNLITDEQIKLSNTILKKYEGNVRTQILYQHHDASAMIQTAQEYSVCPEDALIDELNQIAGVSAKMVYN